MSFLELYKGHILPLCHNLEPAYVLRRHGGWGVADSSCLNGRGEKNKKDSSCTSCFTRINKIHLNDDLLIKPNDCEWSLNCCSSSVCCWVMVKLWWGICRRTQAWWTPKASSHLQVTWTRKIMLHWSKKNKKTVAVDNGDNRLSLNCPWEINRLMLLGLLVWVDWMWS